MAKRKQVETALESWDEADAELARLCTIEVDKKHVEARMNGELTRVRKKYEDQLNTFAALAKTAQAKIEQFCIARRGEFGGKKSLERVHGVVSFRQSPPSVRPASRKWTWQSIIQVLHPTYPDLVRTKVELDKDAILAAHAKQELSDEALAEVGIRIVSKETFGIELRYEEAPAAAQEQKAR